MRRHELRPNQAGVQGTQVRIAAIELNKISRAVSVLRNERPIGHEPPQKRIKSRQNDVTRIFRQITAGREMTTT